MNPSYVSPCAKRSAVTTLSFCCTMSQLLFVGCQIAGSGLIVTPGKQPPAVRASESVLSSICMTAEHVTITPDRASFGDRIRRRWRMDLLFFAIAGAIVTADQLTKWVVRSNLALGESWPHNGGMMKIVHVVNSGAAFGILQGQTPFLIVTSLLGLGAILLYYIYPPMEHGLIRLALGMQLGGAIGNFIDRLRLGEVTDFVHVG